MEEYKADPRIICRYGSKCYQKNPAHHAKYKHPPKQFQGADKHRFAKKRKLNDDNEDAPSTSHVQEEEKISETITKKESLSDCSNEESSIETNSELLKEITDLENPEMREEKQESVAIEDSVSLDLIPDSNCGEQSGNFDAKAFIKQRFLLDLPNDFYQFWEFCKELKPTNPSEAFTEVGLYLVGPYDVLAHKFKHIKRKPEEYLLHWRYYYDPPELLTVLKGDEKSGYHIGYFYDAPTELPPLLASNHANKDGIFSKMGDNIFAAVGEYLNELKKSGDPFKKMHVAKFQSSLKTKADSLKLTMSIHTRNIKKREFKVVTQTFNKIGVVVPYNKKTQLGYRDLAMNDKDLKTLLTKYKNALPEQRTKFLSDLQPVLTYASIALDECDFGTGIKLGWDLLSYGVEGLDSTITRFLCNSYKLLHRNAFAKIAEAHMSNRKKGSNLSIL